MISQETFDFLDELKANNNRDWFLLQKKRYEKVKKEYHKLTEKLLETMKPLDANLELLEVKNCTFRINRDIRFSKDKSPYKTNLGIWLGAKKNGFEYAGYYLHIEKDKSFVAGGLYCPMGDQLLKIRKEIAFFYEDLDEILEQKDFKETYTNFSISEGNKLKNPPRGFEKDHPAIEYLKLKSFVTVHNFDSNDLLREDFVDFITPKLKTLIPLNQFLNRALETEI